METTIRDYADNGFAIINEFYAENQTNDLIEALDVQGIFSYQFGNSDCHNLIKSVPEVHAIAFSETFLSVARNILGANATPYYAIILDKTKESNWGLDWHQDLKIAVRKRIDTNGYFDWSVEAGITHVVPPVSVLEKLLIIRLHLDSCDNTNGAIWAIPQSHKLGIISNSRIQETVRLNTINDCHVQKGGIMIMSPLLLHKSPYSLSNRKRRILQIEYRVGTLENGLEWFNNAV